LNKLLIIRSNSKELAGRSWRTISAVLAAGIASFVLVDVYLRFYLGWQ
jgi:hypothetical protein